MTASDYITSTLYHQREQEMNLRNERVRVARERQDVRPAARTSSPRRRARALRHRLTALVTHAPVRG